MRVEPASLTIGWFAAGLRSMIASRRNPRPARPLGDARRLALLARAAGATFGSRGPTPARSRCGARRLALLARAAGATFGSRGPAPLARAAALEDSLSSRGPQALLCFMLAGP